jgi:hypothetical protein
VGRKGRTLITVKFLTTYTARPFHLIGGIGVVSGLIGAGLLLWMTVEKLLGHGIGQRPALLIGVLLVVVGVQLTTVGLLAELFVALGRGRRVDPVVVRPEEAVIDVTPPPAGTDPTAGNGHSEHPAEPESQVASG